MENILFQSSQVTTLNGVAVMITTTISSLQSTPSQDASLIVAAIESQPVVELAPDIQEEIVFDEETEDDGDVEVKTEVVLKVPVYDPETAKEPWFQGVLDKVSKQAVTLAPAVKPEPVVKLVPTVKLTPVTKAKTKQLEVELTPRNVLSVPKRS